MKFYPTLLRTHNVLKVWQSIKGLIESKNTKGFRSVLLSLGNVVHSGNDEESLYACCCTQQRWSDSGFSLSDPILFL